MEEELLSYLRGQLPAHPRLLIGPGDDAAVLRAAAGPNMVVSVDMLSDGVDFDLAKDSAERVGRKALAVNLSDLAAMAARPIAAVVALLLPSGAGWHLAEELFRGLLPLANEFDVALAGGDTNCWPGRLAVSVTILGETTERGPLLRSGGQVGDRVLATGQFGGSRLGKQFDFLPRVAEALLLHAHYRLHAGIDVSDGLELDLARLARESGCGAAIDLDAVPVSAAASDWASLAADGSSPLDHALGDGEDFELLFTAPPGEAERIEREQPLGVPVTDIGELVKEPGLWHRSKGAEAVRVSPRGWQHLIGPP